MVVQNGSLIQNSHDDIPHSCSHRRRYCHRSDVVQAMEASGERCTWRTVVLGSAAQRWCVLSYIDDTASLKSLSVGTVYFMYATQYSVPA